MIANPISLQEARTCDTGFALFLLEMLAYRFKNGPYGRDDQLYGYLHDNGIYYNNAYAATLFVRRYYEVPCKQYTDMSQDELVMYFRYFMHGRLFDHVCLSLQRTEIWEVACRVHEYTRDRTTHTCPDNNDFIKICIAFDDVMKDKLDGPYAFKAFE